MRSEGRRFLSSLPLQTGLRRGGRSLASQAHFWLSGLLLLEGTLLVFHDLSATKLSSTSMTSNSNLANMRRMVEQLKLEASVERIKVKKLTGGLFLKVISSFLSFSCYVQLNKLS